MHEIKDEKVHVDIESEGEEEDMLTELDGPFDINMVYIHRTYRECYEISGYAKIRSITDSGEHILIQGVIYYPQESPDELSVTSLSDFAENFVLAVPEEEIEEDDGFEECIDE